ncbi:Mss4-like protein [Tricladium varicosporioides]|nr:Mss4-like protein [Hymenoscyphus varicosporioides]
MADTTTPTPAPELKTYQGNCHCGAVKYSVTLPEITLVNECDCSICFRQGYKWVFPPAGGLVFEKGEDKLKDYEFAGKTMAHRFCPTCGTGVMGKRYSAPPGMDIGINVRALNGIDDIWALKVNKFEGAKLDPPYVPHPFKGTEPEAKFENEKTYYGSCHCGATTMAFKTEGPLAEAKEKITQCNCSVCMRNATILHSPKNNAVSIHSTTPLTPYTFGNKNYKHNFCPICGVNTSLQKIPVDAEQFKINAPGFDQEDFMSKYPINLRCFDGVEWEGENKVEVMTWAGGKKWKGEYVVPV